MNIRVFLSRMFNSMIKVDPLNTGGLWSKILKNYKNWDCNKFIRFWGGFKLIKYIVLEFCHDTKRSRYCHLFNLDLGLVYSLPMVSYKDYTRLHINFEPWTTCLKIDCRYWSLKPILLMFTVRGTNNYWLITLSCMGWNMIEVSMI